MAMYFAAALWRARMLLARLTVVLLLGVLVSTVAPAEPCSEATARYLVRGQVERQITSNGTTLTIPAGYAVGWSCTSAADAQRAFEVAAADVP